MGKFSINQKLNIVLRYLEGNESFRALAKEYSISPSIIQGWVRLYEHQGVEGFRKSYTKYSTKFKLDVLTYMNEMGTSSYETATIFNISSPGLVRNWRLKFENGGLAALQPRKKGRKSVVKEKNETSNTQNPVEDSIKALKTENERLRMENAYLKKLKALVQNQEKLQMKSKRK